MSWQSILDLVHQNRGVLSTKVKDSLHALFPYYSQVFNCPSTHQSEINVVVEGSVLELLEFKGCNEDLAAALPSGLSGRCVFQSAPVRKRVLNHSYLETFVFSAKKATRGLIFVVFARPPPPTKTKLWRPVGAVIFQRPLAHSPLRMARPRRLARRPGCARGYPLKAPNLDDRQASARHSPIQHPLKSTLNQPLTIPKPKPPRNPHSTPKPTLGLPTP